MNLKPNKHKRIYFNTTTMVSLGLIALPKILGPPLNLSLPQIQFFAQVPPKIKGGGEGLIAATMMVLKNRVRLSFRSSPSVCKFSQNWLIIFF